MSGLVLRQLFIERVGLQAVLSRLSGGAPPGEQPGGVQGHLQDGAGGLVGLSGDEAGCLHVLSPQVEKMVAVVQDGQGSGMTVEGLQLRQALNNNTHGNFPGPDDRDNPVKVRDADVGGEVVQNEADRDVQPVAGALVGDAA